jgi:bile acid:Na+ symporter, BASS family
MSRRNGASVLRQVVAAPVAQTILIPPEAGMLVSKFPPQIHPLAPHLLIVGTLLLLAGSIPLLMLAGRAFGTLTGNRALLAIVTFIIAGTAAGHFLGGPRAEDRTALAVPCLHWRPSPGKES